MLRNWHWLTVLAAFLVPAACSDDSREAAESTASSGNTSDGAQTSSTQGATNTVTSGNSMTTSSATGVGGASGGTTGSGGATMTSSGGSSGAAGESDAAGGAAGAGSDSLNDTCHFPASAELTLAAVPAGFCAWQWAVGLDDPRGITIDESGDVLVVSRGTNTVVLLHDDDGDGVSGDDERVELATAAGLNHGIAIEGEYLYASSPTTVFRWPYTAGDRVPLGDAEAVIVGMAGGGHATRTLVFDADYLYVSIGSAGNVDPDSERARIRRFSIASLGGDSLAFDEGEVFADGLRNEVGLAFDSQGRLWGVENGRDNLTRDDFTPSDIHQDNPAEELNLFKEPGAFYGYPYCWSEFLLPEASALGPGTQWADPTFINDGTHSDEWCRNLDNVVPPALAMQAHSAPLDLLFYPGGSFPSGYLGSALISFHGSWNRNVPTGYKVMRVPFSEDGMPSGQPQPLLEYGGDGDVAVEWPHRPVGLEVLPSGLLLVTSDASDRILALGHTPE